MARGDSSDGNCFTIVAIFALAGVGCAPWTGAPGPFYLHQVYQAGEPGCTARLTVPL